jgi:hypothetical protein
MAAGTNERLRTLAVYLAAAAILLGSPQTGNSLAVQIRASESDSSLRRAMEQFEVIAAVSRVGAADCRYGAGEPCILGWLRPCVDCNAAWRQIITPSFVSEARAELLRGLEGVLDRDPTRRFVLGQFVWYLTRGGDYDRALSTLTHCRLEPWWCGMLRGFVLEQAGRVEQADSTFLASERIMPAPERCTWSAVQLLLDSAAIAKYASRTCSERDSIERTVWFLSDPSYMTAGNERRALH